MSNGHATNGYAGNGHAGANGRHALADGEDFGELLRARGHRQGAAPTTNESPGSPGSLGSHGSPGSPVAPQRDEPKVGGKVLRPDGSPISGAALTLINLGGHQVARVLTDESAGRPGSGRGSRR